LEQKHNILFLGEGPNNLALMAEVFARNADASKSCNLTSASMTPFIPNRLTEKVIHENHLDLSDAEMHSILDIELFTFDLVITIGDFDQDCRPNLPGMPPHIHWDVPDPKSKMSEKKTLVLLKTSRDLIHEKIQILFKSDLLHVLMVTRNNLEIILDNMVDGVMTHTTMRRIFFFNRSAERITGYRREDVLGRDCHDVFPGRFCGGDCEYCQGSIVRHEKTIHEKDIFFVTKQGKKRTLKMSVIPLKNEDNQGVGALLFFKDNTELNMLKSRLKHRHTLGGLVGKDPKTLLLFDYIREVSSVNVSVLIEGESGTGKELVANAIHNLGSRSGKPFVAINCGALPESILESELFGHVRGAFSGAVQDRKGRFELADKGTIFLDEVSELSPAMQVKLLRVIQEQSFEPVGGEKTVHVDVRILSATNQNLKKMMELKKFRRDLFYRLCVVPIKIAALRDRKLDIPMLVDHFLELTARELHRPVLTPSNDVLDFMVKYSWPGNVRELRNAIEYAYVKCRDGIIKIDHLPVEITAYEKKEFVKPGPIPKDKKHVLLALSQAEGNKKIAAKLLGIGRSTLYRYLDSYGLK
jgi:PAS domain S-box-containing protein